MANANEQITVKIGVERKKQLIALGKKTGVQMSSQIRKWIFERLDEIQLQKQEAP